MDQGTRPVVNKWLWITLIVVAIAAIIFGTWYYLAGPGKTTASNSTTTTTETPAVADETADWQTYTNTTYNFSIKHPKDLVDVTSAMNSEVNSYIFALNKTADVSKGWALVSLSATKSTLSPEAYAKSLTVGDISESGAIKVGDLTGYQEIRQHMRAINKNIYFSNNGNIIRLTLSVAGGSDTGSYTFDNNDFIATFDQIVQTFQFSTTSSATADWKTYTNTKYGFSVKYPNNLALLSTSKDSAASFGADGNSLWVFEVDTTKTTKNLAQANADKISELTGSTSSDTTVGGKPAKKFITPAGYSGNTIYLIVDSGNLYNIVVREDSLTYQNMISTFQFTN